MKTKYPMTCCVDRGIVQGTRTIANFDAALEIVSQYPRESLERIAARYLLTQRLVYARCANCGTTEYRIEDADGYMEVSENAADTITQV